MNSGATTTYRGENGEIRKAFAVDRADIKVWKEENDSGTEVTMIEVPVSSTSQDRDGDAFAEEGIDDLKRQLDSGAVGMWLDHGLSPETMFPDYRVLEQIGGWKAGIIEEKDAGERELFARGALRPSSEEAQELEAMIEEGVAPVGFSVGFIVEEDGEREDIPGKEFRETDLLEISAVGIPSNPDALVTDSVAAMAKGVASATDYEGDPNDLARSMMREARSAFSARSDTSEQRSMLGKDSDMTVLELIEAYLSAEGTSPDDPITNVIDWASEEVGEEAATAVSEAAEETLDDDEEEESISDLSVSDVQSSVKDGDGDGDGEEDEENEEEESSSDSDGDGEEEDDEKTAPGGEEIRSAVRDALPSFMLSEEEFRSEVRAGTEEAIEELDLEIDLTEESVEELSAEVRSNVFGSSDGGERKKPKPAGTISVFEERSSDGNGDESGGKNEGGSENSPRKPSPSYGN